MSGDLHGAAILLYGPLLAYGFLAVCAGAYAIARRPLPPWFWTLSLLAMVLIVVQAGAGLAIIVGGGRPRRALHVLYGSLVLAASIVQYGLRPAGYFRRTFARELSWGEARTLALISLTQAALVARAWMTGLAMR